MKKLCFRVAIIMIVFILTLSSLYVIFHQFFKKDTEQLSNDILDNVYTQITDEINTCIDVSVTMSNDIFLHDFIENKLHLTKEEDTILLREYLNAHKETYQFSSIFLVDVKTNNYYHFSTGLDRTLYPYDDEDTWYFEFLKQDKPHSINIDNDEADNDFVTMFVNCAIKNQTGETIGVLGVGIKIYHIQEFIIESELKNEAEIYLVDNDGFIMMSTEHTGYDEVNIFDYPKTKDMATVISVQEYDTTEKWYGDVNNSFVVTTYIEDLDWHLIVKKNVTYFTPNLRNHVLVTIVILLFFTLIVGFIVSYSTKKYLKILVSHSQKDDLTNLGNRTAYTAILASQEKKLSEYNSFGLGVVDLNNLKYTNDTHGHLVGDALIKELANAICKSFAHSPIFRIGGDEFVIILINMDIDDINEKWEKVTVDLNNYGVAHNMSASVAFGFAFWEDTHLNTTAKIFEAADKAMYEDKRKYYVRN